MPVFVNKLRDKSVQTYCKIWFSSKLERGPQPTAGAAKQEHVSLGQCLLHRTWLLPPPVASFHF